MHNKNSAMAFIVLLGVVSLFSDMTHEAATSIKGAYLLILGASASTIGFISGIGELLGYGLRYLFGRLVDKTHNYWGFMILGYAVDVFAVPALALVHRDGWIAACVLLVVERIGKAIKKPAKNTILSFAASQEGVGKSFAIQEALDQLGAFIGPLLLYVIMLYKNGDEYEVYNAAFAFLTLPAVCTIAFLLFAKSRFPNPEAFEPETKENKKNSFVGRKSFYLYLAGISCFAFGFVDFPLVTMHLAKNKLFDDSILPLLYSGAMLVDAVAALFFGWLFDKMRTKALVISTAISAFFAVFAFGVTSPAMIMLGIALWGVGMGAQESIMKAAVATMTSKEHRAGSYGAFEFFFGLAWFLGSWLLGAVYDYSLNTFIIVSVAAQLIALPCYLLSERSFADENGR